MNLESRIEFKVATKRNTSKSKNGHYEWMWGMSREIFRQRAGRFLFFLRLYWNRWTKERERTSEKVTKCESIYGIQTQITNYSVEWTHLAVWKWTLSVCVCVYVWVCFSSRFRSIFSYILFDTFMVYVYNLSFFILFVVTVSYWTFFLYPT